MRIVFVAFVLAGGAALAQSAEPVPPRLSGRWTFVGPAGVFNDAVSFTFDAGAPAGTVAGRVTWRGVSCGAADEPFGGTWDGAELRIETTLRPNVNTQRANGQCGTGRATFALRRAPGAARFDGDGRLEGTSAVVTVTLAP